MKVLIAEDDENVRHSVAYVLEDAGCEAVFTCNGREAWELLDNGEKFDLVLSDYNMPKMTGLELLRRVRGDNRTVDVIFVLMSGGVSTEKTPLEEVCVELGATFLPKPFSISALFALLGTEWVADSS
ncbi:MAG: response regulator [bacterium]|nr:response regulator [bacterium]MDZ4205771.1 response regulator [Patescibacteria group bacterium]